jgi:hypothetical protein
VRPGDNQRSIPTKTTSSQKFKKRRPSKAVQCIDEGRDDIILPTYGPSFTPAESHISLSYFETGTAESRSTLTLWDSKYLLLLLNSSEDYESDADTFKAWLEDLTNVVPPDQIVHAYVIELEIKNLK